MKFYICAVCGNVMEQIKDNGPKIHCCGVPMTMLEPNDEDITNEKHVPVIENGKVKVGSVQHPMTEEHLIEWVAVLNNGVVKRYNLTEKDIPEITIDSDFEEIYAYCNVHGLWKYKK